MLIIIKIKIQKESKIGVLVRREKEILKVKAIFSKKRKTKV